MLRQSNAQSPETGLRLTGAAAGRRLEDLVDGAKPTPPRLRRSRWDTTPGALLRGCLPRERQQFQPDACMGRRAVSHSAGASPAPQAEVTSGLGCSAPGRNEEGQGRLFSFRGLVARSPGRQCEDERETGGGPGVFFAEAGRG